jgi:uncharacterized protein DUF1569
VSIIHVRRLELHARPAPSDEPPISAATPVRRTVQYASFDDVLADAARLVRARAATTGNWSLDQILGHLAIAMELSAAGFERKAPWPLRLVGRYIFKPRILKHGMKPGYKLPAEAEKLSVPAPGGDLAAALDRLRRAIQRLQSDPTRHPHPFLGPMPAAEWDRLHLRHAELHLSFVSEPSS